MSSNFDRFVIEVLDNFNDYEPIPIEKIHSKNPMNCKNCRFYTMNVETEQWCYMFKDEPTDFCAQFR